MASFSLSSATGLYAFDTIERLVNDLLTQSDQKRTHALFVVDHDALDAANAKYGREAGDAVIMHTTQVLPAVFRSTDLVARTHDDEFVVLMKDVSSLDAIECISGLILQLLRCPCGTAKDPLEATVTVGVATSLGRRPRTFNDLYDNACIALHDAKRTSERETIRVWVAGCSTGEEAYSVAILFREAMDEQNIRRQVKIFATDVDMQSVEIASKGIYPESIVDDVSADRLMRFFEIRGESCHIVNEIRKMIVFAPHNLFTDPPFGKLDLVSCRNVMIYFQPVLQKTLFGIFHSALKDGGYLFLGKSESANDVSDVFVPVCGTERIYAHLGEGKMPDSVQTAYSVQIPPTPTSVSAALHDIREDGEDADKLYSTFLERFLPPSVVIDENNQAVHFFGDYAPYLSISPGKASFSIFNLVHEDLSLAASTAISRCRGDEKAVTYTDIAVRTDDGVRHVDMTVQPLWEYSPQLLGMIALVFTDHSTRVVEEGESERYDIEKTAARRIAYLENELQNTQNELKASISDLETVNEELQAANEELLTTNEELQAANEELYTVDAEYELKLDELTDTTNDLTNFLSSTMIGILFLDDNLNIRKFTEYVGREFNIMAHDVGRSIQIVAHLFQDIDIVEDAEAVLRSLMPIDKEVTTVDGKNYTLRIAPYRTTENSIEGLVLTIIDSIGEK